MVRLNLCSSTITSNTFTSRCLESADAYCCYVCVMWTANINTHLLLTEITSSCISLLYYGSGLVHPDKHPCNHYQAPILTGTGEHMGEIIIQQYGNMCVK